MEFLTQSPCNNCPYRKDAPVAFWHIDEFKKLQANDHEWGAVYGCHKNNGNICVGWLMNQRARHYPCMHLRLLMIRKKITAEFLDGLFSKSPLFASIREMVEANFNKLKSKLMEKKKRGFAAMSPERQREVAQQGGRALAAKVDMVELGRKGGAVSGESRKKAKALKDEKVGVKLEE